MKNQHKQSVKKAAIATKHKDSHHYDFVVLFFLIGYLLIDFMPYAQRMEIIKPQFLYLTVLNIIVAIYIYFNPSLFSTSLIAIFKKSYIFKAYLLFVLLAGLSMIVARNISLSITALAEIIVVFGMFVNFVILLYNRVHLIYKIAFIVGICAFVQALSALVNFEKLLSDNHTFYEAMVATKGNTGNKNILSASIMFKIPFVLIGIMHFFNWKRWFLVLALILGTSLVLILNARSSLISLILVVVVFLCYHFKIHSFKKGSIIKITYIILPILISFVTINLFFSKMDKSAANYSSTIGRLQQININESAANARLTFWKTALHFTKSNPLIGIGLGNWRIESIPYETRKDKIVSLNVHNDFLEITTESGIINGAIYLSIFAMLFIINVKRAFKQKTDQNSLQVILPLLLLLVYGIDALFNFPLYRPTMQLGYCFLMALTFVGGIGEHEKSIPLKNRKYLFALILIAAIPLYVTYHADQTSQLEYRIKSDNIDFNASGKVTGDEIINQKPLFPNVFNTSESFEEYAGIYYFREKKYNQSIKHLDLGNKINPHLGRPNFYKYLMASERGLNDSAYYYLKASFYTYPSTFTLADAMLTAKKYGDTSEILKMYNLNARYVKDPLTWSKAVQMLQGANYSKANLDRFLRQGINDFPNDSAVKSTYKNVEITQLIMKGQALFAAYKPSDALEAYHQALTIDSTNVYIQQNIGFYYYNLGRPIDAIPYLLRALQRPGLFDGKTEYYLAICYFNTNQKSNGCKYLNISLSKNFPNAKGALGQFCN